jgi:hypothetical protein
MEPNSHGRGRQSAVSLTEDDRQVMPSLLASLVLKLNQRGLQLGVDRN